MEFDLEDYLTEIIYPIKALNRISQIIDSFIRENYYLLIKNDCKIYIDEIISLNNTIQMISYCLRVMHLEYYKKGEKQYKDDFTHSSVMYESI